MGTYDLRICNPATFSSLFEVQGNGFGGAYGSYANKYLELMKQLNLTVKVDDSNIEVGERIGDTDMYDGCLGMLQRGEADMIASGVDYPMDIVNVTQGLIILDEKVAFMGGFQRPLANKIADFSRSVYAFDWKVYLLIFIYVLTFAFVFKIRSCVVIRVLTSMTPITKKDTRLVRRRKKLLYQRIKRRFMPPNLIDIIRHYNKSNFLSANSSFSKVMIMTISLFSLSTFAYFESRLNTQLVVPNNVILYETYDQLMKSGVRPLFVKGTTDTK